MSNIVDFPRREPPPEGYSEAYVEKLHAEAFRDLESDLRDSVKMAEITGTLMFNANRIAACTFPWFI